MIEVIEALFRQLDHAHNERHKSIMATLHDLQDAQSAEATAINDLSGHVADAANRVTELAQQLAEAVGNQADPAVLQGIVDSMHVATATATAASAALVKALPAPVVALAPTETNSPAGGAPVESPQVPQS